MPVVFGKERIMNLHLTDNITVLKGIGDKTAALFRRMGVETVEDLLRFYPRDYDRIEKVSRIEDLKDNSRAVVRGTICSGVSERKTGRLVISFSQAADETGKLQLSFFNMPYIRKTLKQGALYYLRGKVSRRGNGFTMEQPVLLSPAEYERQQGRLLPVYPLTTGLNQKAVRKALQQAIEAVKKESGILPEILPSWLREKERLCGIAEALSGIHFPQGQGGVAVGTGTAVDHQTFHIRCPFYVGVDSEALCLSYAPIINNLSGSVKSKGGKFPRR